MTCVASVFLFDQCDLEVVDNVAPCSCDGRCIMNSIHLENDRDLRKLCALAGRTVIN